MLRLIHSALKNIGKKTNRYWNPGIMVDRKQMPTNPDDYGPDIYADSACQFIRENKDRTFLLYYPMILTHPHGKGWPPTPDPSKSGGRTPKGFRSNVEYLDHLVGQVCDTVDELGLGKNTFILFTGDNGTAGAGKGEVTERAARVPFIVKGPAIQKYSGGAARTSCGLDGTNE